ncbi:hypothetical protein ABER31_12390, partial [Cutibacterium acnes]
MAGRPKRGAVLRPALVPTACRASSLPARPVFRGGGQIASDVSVTFGSQARPFRHKRQGPQRALLPQVSDLTTNPVSALLQAAGCH